jgi:hypothetical protein
VRRILERSAFGEFAHLRLTDLGLVKGRTGAGGEVVERVLQAARALLPPVSGSEQKPA